MFPLAIRPITPETLVEGGAAFKVLRLDSKGYEVLIAQRVLPAAMLTALLASSIFDEPRCVGLRVEETDDTSIDGVLFALVPEPLLRAVIEQVGAEDDQWRPSGTDVAADAYLEPTGDAVEMVPFDLGMILRFAANRQFPGDLPREAGHLLHAVLVGSAMRADEKAVENLLGSL